MSEPVDRKILEIPIYGLPQGTDGVALAQKARGLAANLEELGVFDQRDHGPAHRFVPGGEEGR